MILVILIIAVALLFDFLNGFHDSANSIATVVATRVLRPQQAVLMAAFANFIAAFFLTTAVAATIGKGIIDPHAILPLTVLAGVIGASIWNILTWYIGLPVSSSHALIGGLIGAALVQNGTTALLFGGIAKTVVFMFIAPMVGFLGAHVFSIVTMRVVGTHSRRKVNHMFAKLQIISSFFYSMGHGANDAQKTMGIIALTLFSNHLIGEKFYVPVWVIFSSHAAIALGTYFGGWRIVKTMGTKIIRLHPFEGFCAEASSAATLFLTSYLGIPVSTTHVISGSIVGVGTAQNAKQVRWITTRRIFIAWILTIPCAMLFGSALRILFSILTQASG